MLVKGPPAFINWFILLQYAQVGLNLFNVDTSIIAISLLFDFIDNCYILFMPSEIWITYLRCYQRMRTCAFSDVQLLLVYMHVLLIFSGRKHQKTQRCWSRYFMFTHSFTSVCMPYFASMYEEAATYARPVSMFSVLVDSPTTLTLRSGTILLPIIIMRVYLTHPMHYKHTCRELNLSKIAYDVNRNLKSHSNSSMLYGFTATQNTWKLRTFSDVCDLLWCYHPRRDVINFYHT